MIINQANLAALFVAFKSAFQKGFAGAEPVWQQIATRVPSTTKEEKYGWLGQWPGLREWVGDRIIKSLALHDYSIKNKKFESTVGVPRDDIEDDTYGIYTPLMEEQGRAVKEHPDELVFALLKAGFTTTCFDGQFFFDTDHEVNGASVSNMQAGAGNPWFLLDTSRALKPLIYQERRGYEFASMTDKESSDHVLMKDEYLYGVDGRSNVGFGFWQMAFGSKATLDATNFDAAFAAMLAFKNDEGRPLGVKPKLLVCGGSNRSAALEVVKAERRANGATNTNRDVVDVLVVPWLD